MALAALNTKRQPSTIIMDNRVFMFGSHRFRSPENERGGAMDMRRAIVESSNVYFYSWPRNQGGPDSRSDGAFGFWSPHGHRPQGEVTGILPSTDWKRKAYRRPEQKKWFASETISLGIGQGYNSFTMLQMATALGTVVSNGQRFEPRLVNHIENVLTRERRTTDRVALPPVPHKPEHTAFIREAMYGVTQQAQAPASSWGRLRQWRQDRYSPGGGLAAEQSMWPRAPKSTAATTRSGEAFAPLDEPRVPWP